MLRIDSELNYASANQTIFFFSNMWACYLEKQPNLKKWVEIKKELGSAGTNIFAQKHDQEL